MIDPKQLNWGLRPFRELDVLAVFGARTIFQNGAIEFLHDRQEVIGEETQRDILCDWINGKALPALKQHIKEHHWTPTTADVFTLEDGPFLLEASPNQSHGYLYLTGYYKRTVTPFKRYTNTELFNAVYNMAEEAGELGALAQIEDYHLPETFEVVTLTNYQFDCLFVVNYGGSEGIYIDACLRGRIDDSNEEKRAKLGTIKTLNTDLGAMKIMGEACGILTHFASRYVNKNLDNFTPEADLRRREFQNQKEKTK